MAATCHCNACSPGPTHFSPPILPLLWLHGPPFSFLSSFRSHGYVYISYSWPTAYLHYINYIIQNQGHYNPLPLILALSSVLILQSYGLSQGSYNFYNILQGNSCFCDFHISRKSPFAAFNGPLCSLILFIPYGIRWSPSRNYALRPLWLYFPLAAPTQ